MAGTDGAERKCAAEECPRPAEKVGHCWRHAQEIFRHGMTKEAALAQLLDATFKMGACDTDEAGDREFNRHLARYKAALVVLVGRNRLPVTFLSLGSRRIRRQ